MKKVIFVDDEPNVLSGLKRMLRPMRTEWDMEFFESARNALASLDDNPCDVVVSDMRMPEMDGVQFLSQVKEKYPETIRLALSGQTDANMIYRCIQNAHQYLAKPCEADYLTLTVSRACNLQDLLEDDRLKKLVSGMSSLPSLPESYAKIMEELQSEHSSLKSIAGIIEQDVAMTAKILQLVNSAYFGLPRHVSSPAEAAMFLGVDVIKNLALANGVFSQFDQKAVAGMGLNDIWERSLKVGPLARAIVLTQTGNKIVADYASMAGLLGDIGTLVLASEMPDLVGEVKGTCSSGEQIDWEVERELLGYSHMETGAYLVALWGLPNPIVEAIAYHHNPRLCADNEFSALTAVHAANSIVRAEGAEELPGLDLDYLGSLGMVDSIPDWTALYRDMEGENKEVVNG